MITTFEKPELLSRPEIDEKFDGNYVAIKSTDELFSEGLGYVVAIGEKTESIYNELYDYLSSLRQSNLSSLRQLGGMYGRVGVANKTRDEDELYVVFSNVQ